MKSTRSIKSTKSIKAGYSIDEQTKIKTEINPGLVINEHLEGPLNLTMALAEALFAAGTGAFYKHIFGIDDHWGGLLTTTSASLILLGSHFLEENSLKRRIMPLSMVLLLGAFSLPLKESWFSLTCLGFMAASISETLFLQNFFMHSIGLAMTGLGLLVLSQTLRNPHLFAGSGLLLASRGSFKLIRDLTHGLTEIAIVIAISIPSVLNTAKQALTRCFHKAVSSFANGHLKQQVQDLLLTLDKTAKDRNQIQDKLVQAQDEIKKLRVQLASDKASQVKKTLRTCGVQTVAIPSVATDRSVDLGNSEDIAQVQKKPNAAEMIMAVSSFSIIGIPSSLTPSLSLLDSASQASSSCQNSVSPIAIDETMEYWRSGYQYLVERLLGLQNTLQTKDKEILALREAWQRRDSDAKSLLKTLQDLCESLNKSRSRGLRLNMAAPTAFGFYGALDSVPERTPMHPMRHDLGRSAVAYHPAVYY